MEHIIGFCTDRHFHLDLIDVFYLILTCGSITTIKLYYSGKISEIKHNFNKIIQYIRKLKL